MSRLKGLAPTMFTYLPRVSAASQNRAVTGLRKRITRTTQRFANMRCRPLSPELTSKAAQKPLIVFVSYTDAFQVSENA